VQGHLKEREKMPSRILGDGTRMPTCPFSNYKNRFFCVKHNCNTLFFAENMLKDHETFCHSEHPLGGEDASETEQRDNRRGRGKPEDVIVDAEIVGKEPTDEGKVYQTMFKMASEFFDNFLRRGRIGETPGGKVEGRNLVGSV
jgi:hypothetical protein